MTSQMASCVAIQHISFDYNFKIKVISNQMFINLNLNLIINIIIKLQLANGFNEF